MVYCLVLTSDTAIGLSCCDEQAEAERYSMRAFSEKNRKSRATQAAEGVARSLAAVDVLACLLKQRYRQALAIRKPLFPLDTRYYPSSSRQSRGGGRWYGNGGGVYVWC